MECLLLVIFTGFFIYNIYVALQPSENDFFDIAGEEFYTFKLVCSKCGSTNISYGPFLDNDKEYDYCCNDCKSLMNYVYKIYLFYDSNKKRTIITRVNGYKLLKPIELTSKKIPLDKLEPFSR